LQLGMPPIRSRRPIGSLSPTVGIGCRDDSRLRSLSYHRRLCRHGTPRPRRRGRDLAAAGCHTDPAADNDTDGNSPSSFRPTDCSAVSVGRFHALPRPYSLHRLMRF
jgi:hypothetical protein